MEMNEEIMLLQSLMSTLVELVQGDEPDKIRTLLEQENITDKQRKYLCNKMTLNSGELLFHAAARLGDVDVMKVVYPEDAHVRTNCGKGYAALHFAAANGRWSATRWLLSLARTPYTFEPLDVDCMLTKDKNSPLHLAVLFRHKDVAELLVKKKASLTLPNSAGMTPISYCQSSDMFEVLMKSAEPSGDGSAGAGLDLYLDFGVTDATGRSVLHYAALYSRDVDLLTNLIYLTRSHDRLFWEAAGYPSGRVNNVHFLYAVQNTFEGKTLEDLLCGQTDADDQDVSHSPAIVALFHNHRDFFDEIMRMAEAEPNFNLKLNLYSAVKRLLSDTLLRCSFPLPDWHTSRSLQEMGYDSLLEMFKKVLPTYLALYAKKTELFFLMLESDIVTVNQADDVFNRTCLHWAVIHKRADIVRTLMHINDGRRDGHRMSVSPEIQDTYGKTAFQIAFEQQNEELVEIMRENSTFRAQEEKLFKDREVYVQVLNSILVGAALIAGVSFAGWLQLPSHMFSYIAMRVFYMSNTVSFFLALVVMCITIHAMVPTPNKYVGEIRDQMRSSVVIDALLLGMSIVAAAIAFASAGFASLNTATADNTAKIHTMFRTTTIVMGWLAAIPFVSFLVHLYRCTPFWEQLLSSLGVPSRFIYREPFLSRMRIRSQKLYNHKSKEELEGSSRSLKLSPCNQIQRNTDKYGGASANAIVAMKGQHKSLLLFPKAVVDDDDNNNNNNNQYTQ